MPQQKRTPPGHGEARRNDRLATQIVFPDKPNIAGPQGASDKRSLPRQRLARHLHACGPRPMFEAMIAVAGGADLDEVLADFARLPPCVYRACGADRLDVDPELVLLAGGRV